MFFSVSIQNISPVMSVANQYERVKFSLHNFSEHIIEYLLNQQISP